MSSKVEIRCMHCGYFLANRILPAKDQKEFGGIEIPCTNCNTVNVIGAKEKPVDNRPYGERFTYKKKSA